MAYRRFVSAIESNHVPTIPLTEYVMHAGTYQQEVRPDQDEWKNPVWHFTRLIKSYRTFRELDAEAALELVAAQLKKLASGAGDRWIAVTGVEEDEALTGFLEAWNKVSVLIGDTVVTEAERLAREFPAVMPDNLGLRRPPSYLHLLNVCLYLQAERGGGFFMSCRSAASIIGSADHVPAWRLLNLMTADRFLSVVRKGRAGTPGNEATRYKLNLDRLPPDALEVVERAIGRRLRDHGSDSK